MYNYFDLIPNHLTRNKRNDQPQVSRQSGAKPLYFEISTTLVLFIGLEIAFILKPGEGVIAQTGAINEVAKYQTVFKFLYYIRAELLLVLGTSFSEAALPSLIEKLEKMGCHKSVVDLVVPASYSFNLEGTTIYLSMAVVFLAQVYGVQ